jgi:predicted RNA-binding Zn-ribbon protein involved in translation (DUF1610 family)
MPWRPSDGERRNSYCSQCGKRGEPTTVSFSRTVPPTRTITYKCLDCGIEWIARIAPCDALAGEER